MPNVPAAHGLASTGALPSGTVTFLFTDIEGSTVRWDHHPEAMKHAVARHDALLREAIGRFDGHVFKTVGDAFCAAFRSPRSAVEAALTAQLLLQHEDFATVGGLRVRMGIHAGDAHERENDYFGSTVNRVARLMSIGSGGQVLISDTVHDLIANDPPVDAQFLDLGARRLKDLTQPEHVWQVSAAGSSAQFSPLNSLDARPNNLPEQLTELIGRDQDLNDVKTILDRHRLVTISGAGGVGKTRVALQAGADVIDRFAHGVWFADLAPIRDPELVASVVAKALSISAPEGRSLADTIPQAIKGKQLLLILDNCEQIVDAAAAIAQSVLSAAPDVHVLATSRQALGIAGEAVYRLPSLSVPTAEESISADAALGFGAMSLFVERAKAADARFKLSDETAPIVADICRRLDGIPLAIELAAARVRMLSIPNLKQRLNERFKLLTGGSRTALPRQKTLGALIDWSYSLLDPLEQRLFNRLGIFAGGFNLSAASAVCSDDGLDAATLFDLITSLTDKSLVVAEVGGAEERFRLLESTRAYALEKLTAMGEREHSATRHARYFHDVTRDVDAHISVEPIAPWLAILSAELDNFREAMEWALHGGHDATLGAGFAGSLDLLWVFGGLAAEGRHWIGRAQTGFQETAHPIEAARLWLTLSRLLDAKSKCVAAERALMLYESERDDCGYARSLLMLGDGLSQMSLFAEAGDAYERALPPLRQCGDLRGIAQCLTQRATNLYRLGDAAAGKAMFPDAFAACRTLGDETMTAGVWTNRGEMEFADGHAEHALRSVGEALAINARGKNIKLLALNYANAAAYRIALGDFDGAEEASENALRNARSAQNTLYIAISLQHLALLQAHRRHAVDAAHVLGYVDTLFRDVGYARESTEQWAYDRLVSALRAAISDDEIEKFGAEGAAWTEDRAIEAALRGRLARSA